jgi:AsmA protein
MKIAIGLFVVAVLVLALVLSLPFLVDLNRYKDHYRPFIEEALNRKVELQNVNLTIWPRIGARVVGLTVLDDPAFGSSPFTSLTSLDLGVKLMPLLNGRVEVEDITLRDPVITIIKNKNGVLNVSTVGRTGVPTPKTPSRAPIPSAEGPLKILALLAVDRVSVVGGNLSYRDLTTANPSEYMLQDMEMLLRSVRLGQMPSLRLRTLVQPFNLPVTLDGTFGPLKDTVDLDTIDFQLRLGKTEFTITGKMAGQNVVANISSPAINTANLPVVLPVNKPVDINNLQVATEVKGQQIRLISLSLQLFEGQVEGQGSVIAGSEAPPFKGTVRAQGVQIGPALDAVAATHLSIEGTAETDLALKGRGFSTLDLTKNLEGTGHVAVKEGRIKGVNFLREALSILKVAGIAPGDPNATMFSTIETDLHLDRGLIDVRRFLMDSRDFQATGGGTIGFDQNVNLTVNLKLSQDLSQRIAAASPIAKLAMKEGRLSLPLTISGTVQAPTYGLDMKGLTRNMEEQARKTAEEAVGGLLKGTKKPQDLKQQGQDLLKGLLGR